MEVEKIFQETIQQEGLSILSLNRGFQFTETFFPYTSGEIGPYYVQSGVVQNTAEGNANAIDLLTRLCRHVQRTRRDEIITGGETRDWIFSQPAALQLYKPHTMLYKDGKTVGAALAGRNVIHVADLNNEGSSPRDYWVPIIKREGGMIEDVFFFVDRLEGGVAEMRKLQLNSYAVVPLDTSAWDYLRRIGVVNEEVYRSLCERSEDRAVWARQMLASEAGLRRLSGLLADDKQRAKGEKILNVGYPDMKQEILTRLDEY